MSFVQTSSGAAVPERLLGRYLCNLVNQFFKILPLRESEEETLGTYMESLQRELIGAEAVIAAVDFSPLFFSLIAILQYLIDHPDSTVSVYKREVFKAISILNKFIEKCPRDASQKKEAHTE